MVDLLDEFRNMLLTEMRADREATAREIGVGIRQGFADLVKAIPAPRVAAPNVSVSVPEQAAPVVNVNVPDTDDGEILAVLQTVADGQAQVVASNKAVEAKLDAMLVLLSKPLTRTVHRDAGQLIDTVTETRT